jgi:hypothetical protein
VTGWEAMRRGLAVGAYAALLFATAPASPDDWDGVGFVESVHDFDLAHFKPHPPGYPVYVALLHVAGGVVRAPLRACILVAVASGVVALALIWDAARRAAGERAAWVVATLVGATPVVWRACSGVGSEAPALACVASCAWGLAVACRRPSVGATVLGLGAGLGLGVRLSWAPLFVSALAIAPRDGRARAWGTAAAASAAWIAPFLACVGPGNLAGLYAEHFEGHAARWGGTIVTSPGSVRFLWLARDLLLDGLGVGSDPLGLAIGALVAIAAVRGLIAWRLVRWRAWREATIGFLPYVLWIWVGQNLRDQPRHALPVVAALAAALALPVACSRGALPVTGALLVAVSIRTARDAYARRTVPPPGEQLVELAQKQESGSRLAVFGGASIRFFEIAHSPSRAFTEGSLGDARTDLTRLDDLPARVWVTSELAGLRDSPWPLEPVARLCRPPRLDRRMPCLDVYSWQLPFLPEK